MAAHRRQAARPWRDACRLGNACLKDKFTVLLVGSSNTGRNTALVTFCPGCGCGVTFHDAIHRIGDETIAHCENCGPCWKPSNTPFLGLVQRRLESVTNGAQALRFRMNISNT